MTSRPTGRHRAPSSAPVPAPALSSLAPRRSLPHLSRAQLAAGAGPVAKAGAVLAVSGGLVASLGLQASAASADAAPSASVFGTGVALGVVPAAGTAAASTRTTAVASTTALPGTVTSAATSARASIAATATQAPRVAAQFGEIGFTATAAPKPKPKPKPKAKPKPKPEATAASTSGSSDRTTRVSRSTTRSARSSGSTGPSTRSGSSSRDQPSTRTVRAGAPGSASFGAAVLSVASRYSGIDYVWGGTTPAGFDCSGFTSYVMRQVGISLPRTSSAQRGAVTRVSRSQAMPGDLVFMPGHVGIYAGNGMMWDSPHSGASVSKRAVYSSSATYRRVG